jgi:hypothetical protein
MKVWKDGVAPLIPSEVTPWFTAFSAYSGSALAEAEEPEQSSFRKCTYLDEFAAKESQFGFSRLTAM